MRARMNLQSVRDIGGEVASSIREYFDEPRNRQAAERLAALLEIQPLRAPAEGRGALRDKSFVLTGTLENLSREEAEQKYSRGRGQGDVRGQPQDRFCCRRRRARVEAAQGGRIGG